MRVLVALLILNTCWLSAQESITISGTITDSQNGENLTGVAVYDSISLRGTLSNSYGFYSLTLKSSIINLKVSIIGYRSESLISNFKSDTVVNFSIKPVMAELGEVVITENRHRPTQTGVILLKTSQIKSVPVFMGEGDLLKTIQLLPGIKSGTEGTSGLYVRGGSPDQNLILLDGVPIYNSSHAFGFFSVFNPDAVTGITFYKGGIPARYSGRLSSVLDIQMKEGNNKELTGKVSVGLIASNFIVEGPIGGENTSFFISGRRTFIDLLTKPFNKEGSDPLLPNYSFYDINGKVNHRINENNRLFLSIYTGKDNSINSVKEKSEDGERLNEYKDGFGWGNLTTSLRWNSIATKKLFSNITVYHTKYRFSIYRKREEQNLLTNQILKSSSNYFSGISDIGGRWQIDWFPTPRHSVRTGLNITYHSFNPGITVVKDNDTGPEAAIDTTLGSRSFVLESNFYFEDEIKVTDALSANLGLNYSVFSVDGKNFLSLQPRVALDFSVTPQFKLKSSYGTMSQFLHLLTNSTTGLPTDLWLPVTQRIKPEKAWQIAAGAEYLLNRKYTISLEGYFKQMDNLIDYKEGASFFKVSGTWEDKVETGSGKSKGLELLIRKEEGKTTGWIGVTLSKTTRQFENLNNGVEYLYRYDRRLDIGIMVIHKFNEKISASCSWTFGTGNRITLPQEIIRTFIGDSAIFAYENMTYAKNITGINNFLTPAYHRLDVGVDFNRMKKNHARTWSVGLYNAYNRKNPFYLYADLQNKPPVLKQFSLFPVLPYFKYSITF